MSKSKHNLEFDVFGNRRLYDETDLFDVKSYFDDKGEKVEIKPHFVPVWNTETNEWNFRSKKTGKFYRYTDLVVFEGYFWESNKEWVEKTRTYDVSPVFFSYWVKMMVYYNSFKRYNEALEEYTGKPKGRDTYADLEREKWFRRFSKEF